MDQHLFEAIVKQPINGVLATNRHDGAPHLSPIWYLYEDGRFYISLGANSVKASNARRDPRVSLCIDEGHPEGRAVTINGSAELIDDESPWRDGLNWRITRHYHETEAAARHYKENTPDWGPWSIMVVTPEKIYEHSDA